MGGCSVFGESNVEIAPYNVLQAEEKFELRTYPSLVLVSTAMMDGMDNTGDAFGKLFNYISGKNETQTKIAMTAPVFMDQTEEAKETKSETMSFVMPASFDVKTTPPPSDPAVKVEELTDYTVATIRFSGRLTQDNINKHRKKLENWIDAQGLEITGPAKAAGYNPPFTLPQLRRNEVLIPVKLKKEYLP